MTIRELTQNPRFRRHGLAVCAAVVVFSYLGPFGTSGRLATGELFVYWALAIIPVWLLAMIVFPLSLGGRFRSRPAFLVAAAVATLACAVPGTGIILALEAWMAKPIHSALNVAYVYSCVVLVVLIFAFLSYRLVENPRDMSEDPADGNTEIAATAQTGPEAPSSSEFARRLPDHLGTDILYLRMQDHYVEVHTERGKDMILLRFRDAIRELAGSDGRQVHRSHWVARRAVEGTVRKEGRLHLKLSNGTLVPVSRTFLADLKKDGWL